MTKDNQLIGQKQELLYYSFGVSWCLYIALKRKERERKGRKRRKEKSPHGKKNFLAE